MIWQKILAIILALLLSDLYIIVFKKILPIYEKRINTYRHKQNESQGTELKDIKYPKSFITKYSILIISCVILGIIITTLDIDNDYLIPLLRSMAAYGIGFLSVSWIIVLFVGKIKKTYNQIKHGDPYYHIAQSNEDEVTDKESNIEEETPDD